MDAPEPYSNAWYRQQLGGLNVRANRSEVEWDAQRELITALTKRLEALEAGRTQDMATIGELKSRVTELEEWRKKFAPWVVERVPKEKNGHAA